MPFTRSLLLALVALVCLACGGEQPTAPGSLSRSTTQTGTPVPSAPTGQASQPADPSGSLQTFSISGTVTGEQGQPLAGVPVVMRIYNPKCCIPVTVVTDAAGRYTVDFQSTPWGNAPYGPYAARAELLVDGYDWYYRDVKGSNVPIVENFRLNRVIRIAAGDAVEIALTPENGSCLAFLFPPCGRLRITVPEDGELTIEGVAIEGDLDRLWMELCCVNGVERYGNPVTIPVKVGSEVWVEVGQPSGKWPSTAAGRVRLTTSFKGS